MRVAIANIFAMFTSNISTIWQQLPGSPSPVFVSVVHVEAGIQFSLLSGGFPICALPELISQGGDPVAERRDTA